MLLFIKNQKNFFKTNNQKYNENTNYAEKDNLSVESHNNIKNNEIIENSTDNQIVNEIQNYFRVYYT